MRSDATALSPKSACRMSLFARNRRALRRRCARWSRMPPTRRARAKAALAPANARDAASFGVSARRTSEVTRQIAQVAGMIRQTGKARSTDQSRIKNAALLREWRRFGVSVGSAKVCQAHSSGPVGGPPTASAWVVQNSRDSSNSAMFAMLGSPGSRGAAGPPYAV